MRWAITTIRDWGDPEAAIEQDDILLDKVAAGHAPPTLRIWQTTQSIAVPRHFSKSDGFAFAAKKLADQGWPIVPRSSGGSAMPQGPGVINVSMMFPRDSSMSIDAAFQLLTEPLCAFLNSLGLSASVGSVSGSFCDGRYNLVANQRKLAGTAQKRKKHAVLAHAALQLDLDLTAICQSINYLNEKIGRDERCRPDAATTMALVLGRDLQAAETVQRLEAFFAGKES